LGTLPPPSSHQILTYRFCFFLQTVKQRRVYCLCSSCLWPCTASVLFLFLSRKNS